MDWVNWEAVLILEGLESLPIWSLLFLQLELSLGRTRMSRHCEGWQLPGSWSAERWGGSFGQQSQVSPTSPCPRTSIQQGGRAGWWPSATKTHQASPQWWYRCKISPRQQPMGRGPNQLSLSLRLHSPAWGLHHPSKCIHGTVMLPFYSPGVSKGKKPRPYTCISGWYCSFSHLTFFQMFSGKAIHDLLVHSVPSRKGLKHPIQNTVITPYLLTCNFLLSSQPM